jgi:hypothetical protein
MGVMPHARARTHANARPYQAPHALEDCCIPRLSHVALHHVEWHPSYRLETFVQTSGAALQAK